ncbi:DUF1858 domain-containing protein [Candidatus Beckwithbacteria bacterium]|nr:DUF1858 domain-containing protein [Candidatus Beckwithbacteria bacterium]
MNKKNKIDSSTFKISKDMMMGEIITEFPETIELLLEMGLHCATCHMAAFETLEEGAQTHGMNKKQISNLVKMLNERINNE